jgi:hypothetical protein
MATKIRVRYLTRDVTTWQSPILTVEDFGGTEDDTDEALRGKVFRSMNAVDGDPAFEVCIRLRVRSMMVGDVVVIDRGCCSKAFRVEPVGWSEVV